MAGENEPAKLLLPYLQRADELQKHEPLVAYYCRLFAMEKGLRIPQSERTKTTNALLVSLMKQLEKDKKSLKLSPEDSLHLEGFALNLFAKADKQDRAGRSDLNTAKTFYAASIFFEILNQFGPVQPDLEQKQKYAIWKAADIRKALKEGRKPNPGPPVADDDLSVLSSTPSGEYDLGPPQNSVTSSRPESDLSPQFQDRVPPQFQDKLNDPHSANIPRSSQFDDKLNNEHSASIPPSPPSYPSAGYPAHDFQAPPPPPPPPNRSESSMYSQPYDHQQYPQEPQQHLPHNYSSHEGSPYTYPNFQSYPSFTESSLPSVPTHYPSHYQGSDTSYSPHSAPPTASYQPSAQATSHQSSVQYSLSSKNGTISDSAQTSKQSYQYDSNYQPPPEKIAEAHKAARFAVGALAFDDVSVAVDFLRKSLELLTNPSAAQ
ncbi:vacuolar protein sorting-associated protein VTA1 [Tripterygium wilfordii]|uniref:Vacuolar protein sorting-associated protein VTA1 n=1 Tax=Tripterygium wilfordii TaxID=458696 RepID=A0A7J7C1D5_TRIWF|nr:protein HOMOLOG OF MAMMALIAN LYST-INTERACTING PROTEIN 5 [Tripterygium wilfordii]KAF5727933.1 vacuolar protein sorting-associated protein VTA1 [Tripterygium wilfordii]